MENENIYLIYLGIMENEKLNKVFIKISYTNKDITIKMRIYTLYTWEY